MAATRKDYPFLLFQLNPFRDPTPYSKTVKYPPAPPKLEDLSYWNIKNYSPSYKIIQMEEMGHEFVARLEEMAVEIEQMTSAKRFYPKKIK